MLRILLLFTISVQSYAQKQIKLWSSESNIPELTQNFQGNSSNVLEHLFKLGYPEAEIIDSSETNTEIIYTITAGVKYQIIEITPVNIDKNWIKSAGLSFTNNQKVLVGFDQVFEVTNKLLLVAAENGYPLSESLYKNWVLSPIKSTVELHIEKNSPVVVGSLILLNDSKTHKKYFASLLNIKENHPYNHKHFLDIEKKLSTYSHIQLKEKPKLYIEDGKANITVLPELLNSNQLDFLLGVLPNSNLNNKLLITGIAKGNFTNLTGWGDLTSFLYEQIRPLSRNLNANFFLPHLPGLSFGSSFDFALEKRDTNFIQVRYRLGLVHTLDGTNWVKVFWKREKSSLINPAGTDQIQPFSSYSTHEWGLEVHLNRLDYSRNPRKGWRTQTEFSLGQKKTSDEKNFRIFGKTKWNLFIPTLNTSTVMIGLESGIITNPEKTFTNEMFRIGGINTLRGFDQEFFFVKNYAILTGEFRLLIDQNAYLAYFIDYGILNKQHQLWGTGGGISFETGAGNFNLNLGFGKNQGQSFDFTSPKIHFGYLSNF
jgi:outer membrane protein assembly factor BamA